MKLEIGKRYRQRDGQITSKLVDSGEIPYKFSDPYSDRTWKECGNYWSQGASNLDIVEEYEESFSEDSPDTIPLSLEYIYRLIKQFEQQEASASGIKIKLTIE